MKATIGVYDTHEKAIEAIKELKNANFPVKHLSIIDKLHTEHVDDKLHISEKSPLKIGGIEIGTALGVTLGVLTGVGVFAIPGVGFLFGAGALIGGIAGFDFGLMGGGIASAFINLGMQENFAKQYQADLEKGNYLVVAQGSADEMKHAHEILTTHGTHSTLETHS